MNKKIFVSDFDGTLIDSEEAIPMTTVLAIDEFRSHGNKFVIATGRIPISVLNYNSDFVFMDYVIACNGAYIYDIALEKVIYKNPLPKQVVRTIKQSFEAVCCIDFCTPDCWHLYISTIYKQRRKGNLTSDIKDFNRFLSRNKNNIYKIELHTDTQKKAKEILKELKKMNLKISYNLQVYGENSYIIDITAAGVNKYEAVCFIADYESVKMEEIVAIGDGSNDIEMIQNVGYGIAVANACKEVIKVAKEKVESNEEHGVEKVLNKMNQLH